MIFGLEQLMAGFAIGGILVRSQGIGLSGLEGFGGHIERRRLLFPDLRIALLWSVEGKRLVIFDEPGDFFFGAFTLEDMLGDVVVAFVKRFHHFLNGVFGMNIGRGCTGGNKKGGGK